MEFVTLVVTFIAPVLSVTFIRSKRLAVFLGTVSFFSGIVLNTVFNCLKPQLACTAETYKAEPLFIGLIAGLVYSLLALVVSRLMALLSKL